MADMTDKFFTITRQDGKKIYVQLDTDGLFDWDIRNDGEAYLLVVTSPYSYDEDALNIYDDDCVIGVFYTRQEAKDAAGIMEETSIVPYNPLSAIDYLEANNNDLSFKDRRELKGLTALQYINEEEADED